MEQFPTPHPLHIHHLPHHNLLCTSNNIIHPPHPKHLILRFQLLCHLCQRISHIDNPFTRLANTIPYDSETPSISMTSYAVKNLLFSISKCLLSFVLLFSSFLNCFDVFYINSSFLYC